MSVIINEMDVKSILYNDSDVKKWIHEQATVWQKYIAATGRITAGILQISGDDGWPIFPGYSYTCSELSEDAIIGWDSTSRGVQAKSPCTVKVSGAISASSVDCQRVWSCINLYKNSGSIYTIADWVDAGESYYNKSFSTGAISLAKGDILCVRAHSYDYLHGTSHRTRYQVTSPITFSATPI